MFPMCAWNEARADGGARTAPEASNKTPQDGSLWARGRTLDGKMHGYWELFRGDSVIMRSGHFDKGNADRRVHRL